MRGIEAQGRDIPKGSNVATFECRTERVATILDQPEIVLSGKSGDGIKIKNVSERMRDEDRLGPIAARRFELAHINLIARNSHVHENRYQTVLKNGIHGGRKTR